MTRTTGSGLAARRERFEAALLAQLMSWPAPVQRVLAGRGIELDGQRLAVDVQLMLRLQRASGPAVETLPIARGRVALLRQCRQAGGPTQPVAQVRELQVDGADGPLAARLYTPTGAPTAGPLLVFLHGGGFIYGDLDSHDAPCRFLAERADVRVLAIDYRLAPEHRFPAAYDDALAAFAWAHEHAGEIGADPARIGVGGDSAGGNLAAGVAHAAARSGLACRAAILVYPAADRRHTTRSEELFGERFYLTADFMRLANESYTASPTDPEDPRFSPGLDEVPPGLAPTWVFTAGFDPLRDEGEAYAAKLAAAGVPVRVRRFTDQVHGFLNVLVNRSSVAAVNDIAAAVRMAL